MDTRRQILDATQRVIRAQGMGRVTTRDIAREAGVADGTLYVHFPHKEDLFLAVIQENLPDFTATVQPELAGTKPLDASLEEIASAVTEYYARLMPWGAALFADAELLARHREWMAGHGSPQRIYERVAAYVEAEQRLGRIRDTLPPMSVAAALLGPCFQYAFLEQFLGHTPPGMPRQRYIADLVHTLLEGLVPG